MKLYLSSYRLPVPEELFALLPKIPVECKVAIIPNAKDYKLPNERANSLDELLVYLGGWGFKCDIIDLRDYDDQPNDIEELIEGYDLLWLAGGNAFMLREAIRTSGLEYVIKDLIDSNLVCVGESAGAIILGKTLEGSEIADEPSGVNKIIYDGLNFVDKTIVPHADSEEYTEYINVMRKKHDNDPNVIYINDAQAYVINDGIQKMIGTNE